MMSAKNRKTILYILFAFIPVGIFGQDINRNVVVVKPYEPSLSDAYKISSLPRIDDTSTIVPDFSYSIIPTRVEAPFDLKPINAAKMVGLPMEKLYKSYLRLGGGNYYTTLAEYNFNTLRSKDHSLGAHFFHKSSNSKLELNNGQKVPAGYSFNRGEGYANKYFQNATLSGKAYFDQKLYHHYGYNTSLFTDSFPLIKEKDIRQYYNVAGADFKVSSANTDSSALNFNLGLGLNYLWDRFKYSEGDIVVTGGLSSLVNEKVFGADIKLDYLTSKLAEDTVATTLVSGSPFFSKKNEEYEFLIGGRIAYATGAKDNFFVFPRAYLQINVVKNILMPYIGVDGDLSAGSYMTLINENPYLHPGSMTKNMDKMFAYGGIKGVLSSKAAYNLGFSYSTVNNMPFFVNDSTGEWDNTFAVIYDNTTITGFSAEISYDPSADLNFLLKTGYKSYNPGTEEEAWHKPSFDLTFATAYSFHDKILVNFDITALGSRYAKVFTDSLEPVKLDPVIDINLGIEYKYSKVLSVFLNFYNLASSKYYYWNQYPNQKFNFVAGFSYKL